MNYKQADLSISSNCQLFIAQVFEGKIQINRLKDNTFLKLGRFTVAEWNESILPLINSAIKAINNAPKESVKTITKKKDKQALVCPFKRADNDLTIGRDFGLYNVCANHCQIAKECKAICKSLQTPIVEPVIEIIPIEPIAIAPVSPAKTTTKRKRKAPVGKPLTSNSPIVQAVNESKLSDKARAHMVALLKTNNVSVSNGITDNALRLLYKNLKG